MSENGNYDRVMASEHRTVLIWLIYIVYGAQDEVEIDVAETYFTTQGVSLRRDVD
jgi:hypothetical protein